MHIRTTTTPTSEGKIPIDIPQANKPCFTWYKIVGDLAKSNKTPLILLHGGPGCGHNYLLPFKDLWEKEQIPCIFYDQVGCGQSTRLREKRGDESFWTIELFIKELNNVIDHFDLRSRGFDILGQSWGGMLLAEYAILQPKGLRRCVIANSPASMPLWVEAAQTLLKGMPKDIQKVIAEADKERKYDTPEFKEANELFDRKHTYRVGVGEPWPGKYAGPSLNNLAEDDTVYWTM
jgi:proline-specific peptidase